MRIGTVGYAHNRGLGHLVRDFHRAGVVTDVVVVRHPNVPWEPTWYPGAPVTDLRRLDKQLMLDTLSGCDAALFFETPFDWSLFDALRKRCVRTFLVTMYECTPASHPKPDVYLCPSKLDVDYFGGVYVELPTEMPWRRRGVVRTFAHNGGYLGMRGREGTVQVIEAMQYVRSPLTLHIRVQENVGPEHQRMAARDGRVTYTAATVPYQELFQEDALVAPQKFNGCSLPLQEAYASGMLVCTTDRYPMNTWLPRGPMFTVAEYARARIGGSYMEFNEAKVEPREIARVMDKWYGQDVGAYSDMGRTWAETRSWAALKPRWMEVLSAV